MKITRKLSVGHYLHIASGLHIVACVGEQSTYWNIWEDANLIVEWAVGINTKRQCIEKINKYYSNQKNIAQ